MAGGMFTNNTTIKVNSAVSATGSSNTTLYTAPASGYAWVNISISIAASLNVKIDSKLVLAMSSGSVGAASGGSNFSLPPQGFIIGPSQAISITDYSSGTVTVTGVSFINSP